MKRDTKLKLFKATVKFRGEMHEVPIWAETIEAALKVADLEYGEDNVYRLRPEVTHG